MAAKSGQKPDETLQIVILTLFMTAGFFAIGTVVLLFLIPGMEEEVAHHIDDLQSFRTQVRKNGELWKLREQVEFLTAKGGEGEDDNLRSIVSGELEVLNIVPRSFPATSSRPISQRGSTVEHSQSLNYEKIDTQRLLNLLAQVKDRRQGIYVHTVTMARDKSSTAENPTWSGKVLFTFYSNPEAEAELRREKARKAKKPAPTETAAGGG